MAKSTAKQRAERTERMEIRLEASEKEAFQKAADATGTTLSSWIRERLRRAARSDLETAGEAVPFLVRR